MPREIHSALSTWGAEMDKANNNSQELYGFVAALQTNHAQALAVLPAE
jgi:hypothetical protein